MKRALYVSAFAPDRHAGHAGGQAAFANLSRLREEFDEVRAVVCTTEAIPIAASDLHSIAQSGSAFVRAAMNHLGRFPMRGLAASVIHTRLNDSAIAVIREEIDRFKPEVLFCDFTQMHLTGLKAVEQASHRPRLHLCWHDVFAQRCLRSQSLRERLLTGWVMQEERLLVEQADEVLVLCEKDAHLMRSLYLADQVSVLPFRPPAWVTRVDRQQCRRGRVLFFANFDRDENREAASWLVNECAPQVFAAHPEFRLVLAGAGSDRLRAQLPSTSWLSATGFVEDPALEFGQADFCIAPLARGAGVKFKVLEALASKAPVIATPVAAEGIDAHPLLRVVHRHEFASAMIDAL